MQLQVLKGDLLEWMKELFRWELCVTVNSDDPPFFGGYVNENFRFWATELGLRPEQLLQLAENSVTAAFLPDNTKIELKGRLEQAWNSFPVTA